MLAGGLWLRMDNAAGHGIYEAVTGGVGSLAFLAPVLVALLAWRFLRHPDRNQATRRAAIGWAALLLGLSGLLEIAKGSPHPSDGAAVIRKAGGFVGYGVGGPLARALTPWVAAALLALLALFGLLLITGTTLHRIPERLSWPARAIRARPAEHDDEDGLEIDEDYEAGTGTGPVDRAARSPRTSGCARPWRAATTSSRTTRRWSARARSAPARPRPGRPAPVRTARPA